MCMRSQVCVCVCVLGARAREGGFKSSNFACKYDVNIITDTSRAHHTPCDIQSLVITASFTAWVMMAVAVIVLVVAAGLVALEVVLDVLIIVNVNVFAGVMAAFEIAMLGPSEAFRC